MIVLSLWRNQPGKFFCLSTKTATGTWQDHFFTRTEVRKRTKITAFIKANSDRDIYFCPHGFTEQRRRKEFAVLPHLLWSDMDEADPRTVKITPSVAIESSPGRFVGLWVVTDREVTEELNRRLAYVIGGDKSGWDLTQVLRVPGTTNYKYDAHPRVKILWSDRPSFTVDELEKLLPNVAKATDANDQSTSASVFKKYEKKLPRWARTAIMQRAVPRAGTRSEMLWKLEQVLIESGMTTDEAFVVIKASVWNKYAGRRSEEDQLRRDLDKAVNHHLKAGSDVAGEDDKEARPKMLMQSMDTVEEENLDWIWYPYLARSELSILEGDPGLGKSYLAQMVAAAICDGKRLPTMRKGDKPILGKVVYFDLENSAGTVTKKRLLENKLENMVNFIQCEDAFSIDDDDSLENVYEELERIRPALVVFDTINTYMGKADAYKGHEVTQTFKRFREIAKRFNCAVLVLRHLTKSTKEKALYRGQGSIAFAGLARVVITCGTLPDDPDWRAFAITKINVARPPQAHSFTIEGLPDTKTHKDRSQFVWGDYVDVTADQILNGPTEEGDDAKSVRAQAKEWLANELDAGPVEATKLKRMGEARSFSSRTLERAKKELNVQSSRKGFGEGATYFWELPE